MKISYSSDKLTFIEKVIEKFADKSDRMIVIFPYRKMIDILYEKLKTNFSVGTFYSENIKSHILEQEKTIQNKKIILAISTLARQSLDIPECNCLILVVSAFMHKGKDRNFNTLLMDQYIGRLLRKNHKTSPNVVIINDDFSVFKRHARLREKYFKEIKKWKIKQITI